jgi:hypothetical protein
LARKLVGSQRNDILDYHRRHLRKHGSALSIRRLGTAVAIEAFVSLLNPRSTVRRLRRSARASGKRRS